MAGRYELDEEVKAELREYLERNPDRTVDILKDIGSDIDKCYREIYDVGDLCDRAAMADNPRSEVRRLVNSVIKGNVISENEPVRYDDYGFLYTIKQEELEKEAQLYIDNIISYIEDWGTSKIDDTNIDEIVQEGLSEGFYL